MKLGKRELIVTGAMALLMSFHMNVMSPTAAVLPETCQVESASSRTTPCTNHDWLYVTRTMGNIVYYNYQCELCGTYKYSPWIKK